MVPVKVEEIKKLLVPNHWSRKIKTLRQSDQGTVYALASDFANASADRVSRGWTQSGYAAANEAGQPVLSSSPAACKFCAMGGVWAEMAKLPVENSPLSGMAEEWIMQALAAYIGSKPEEVLAGENVYAVGDVFKWNDAPGRLQEEVVDGLRFVADVALSCAQEIS